MSAVFQAHDVPVISRADYWEQVLEDVLVPLRGRHDGTEDFRAWLVTGDVGAVRVAESMTPAGECVRTSRLADRSKPERADVAADRSADGCLVPGLAINGDPPRARGNPRRVTAVGAYPRQHRPTPPWERDH